MRRLFIIVLMVLTATFIMSDRFTVRHGEIKSVLQYCNEHYTSIDQLFTKIEAVPRNGDWLSLQKCLPHDTVELKYKFTEISRHPRGAITLSFAPIPGLEGMDVYLTDFRVDQEDRNDSHHYSKQLESGKYYLEAWKNP